MTKHRRLPGVRVASVRRDARAVLLLLGESAAELSVSLVGDRSIQDLNRRYRGEDRPTDVLAFAMREGEAGGSEPALLGDVVISADTAARQARRRRHSLGTEVQALLVHGILHLLGYDHERSPSEARRMRALEKRLRRLLRRRRSASRCVP